MPRFSQYRFSRTVVSIVLAVIIIGAAYEFHRSRKGTAAAPPLGMSVSPASGNAVSMKPMPLPAPVGSSKPLASNPPNTLVTQTPDFTRRNSAAQLIAPATPGESTQAKPISNVPTAPTPTQVLSTLNVSSAAAAPSASTLSDATAKVTAGDLLGARDLLNGALLSGKLSAADTDMVKKQMADLNQTIIFSPRQFPKDPLGGVYTVKSGDRLAAIGTAHEIPYELLLPLNRMSDAKKLRYGQALKVINGPFHVVITKSKFIMDVYLGSAGGPQSTYITSFPVGLGTDNSTPTGTWSIKNKVTHPTYFPPEGHAGPVLDPNDPKNPLGNYWMGLEGTDGQAVGQRSYGIHGTIDPTSIGKQSSMGCIRLKNEDVEVVYRLLFAGKSSVVVKD